MGECKDCKLDRRVERLETDMKENKLDVKELTQKATTTDAQYGFIVQSIGELKGQVNSILQVPNKRMEVTITAIITAVLTACVAYFIGK